jgi:ubiquitin-protein ligase
VLPGKPNRPSPYAGRTFEAIVTVPEKYPHIAPESVVFTAGGVYHPSVKWTPEGEQKAGQVCHMVFSKGWAATMSMFTLGTLLIEMLKAPDLSSPVQADIAMEITERAEDFCKAAAAAAAKLPEWGAGGGGGGGGGGGR